MKKLLAFLMSMMLFAVLAAGCGGGEDQAGGKAATQKFINIATGGTAGTYYPLGGAIADILNKNIPGCNASAQATGASIANINMLQQDINMLQQGQVDIAFIQNDNAYYAVNGTEMFKDKKVTNLYGMATLYPETIQIVTLAETGITDLSQVKGKRVAVGAPGSGTEANARQILAAYGVTYDDINVQYLSFAEASSALKDGNVDVAFVTAGHPTAAIQDIATQNDVVLLPVATDKADALIKEYPFYTKVNIPANTYNKQAADCSAVAVRCMLAVTDKMDADTGYAVTKAIYTITKESAMDGMSIPVNAGAEKFFKEK